MIAVGDVGGDDDERMPFSSTPALALVFCSLTFRPVAGQQPLLAVWSPLGLRSLLRGRCRRQGGQ